MQVKHKIVSGLIGLTSVSVFIAAYSNVFSYKFKPNFPNYFPINMPAAMEAEPIDPTPSLPGGGDSLKYPIKPVTGDHITDPPKNPFYLPDPSNIKKDVEYDPVSGKYLVTEKVGDVNIKEPQYLTYDEYLKYTEKQERDDYFKSRSNAIHLIEEKGLLPPINMKSKLLDRLFGGTKIEIKPQGNLAITLGGNSQRIENPNIPVRNRKTGGFDFDMNINMNVVGKIGDKLQLGIKYNTQSGFDFENQIKLGYQGQEDDIVKEISLGNVSLPLPTRLINGSQALFGVKVKLQFGRLTWTSIISQQKSKRETVVVESGAQRTNFEIKADQYDENRHFFLAQYFRDKYDYALSSLPIVKSVVNVTKMEVWVTNRNGTTQNVRDVVALADIGEANPYHYTTGPSGLNDLPDNGSNGLYGQLAGSPNGRFVENTVGELQNLLGLEQAQDFEKTYARKLQTTEYTFNPSLGFLSLNTSLNPNDVLAVAFQYEVNGKVFQVGEFANQVPPDSNTTSKVIYLKLLKGTSVRPRLPFWNLMMKNVYSLGAYQVSNEDFRLDITYNDPGGGEKRYMPQGGLKGIPLLKVLNLDNVNVNNDQQPDGLYDFIPGVTIIPQNGRIIFPVKEPFGDNLRGAFKRSGTADQITDQYIYDQLYDSTKFVAQQFPEFNRFVIRGQYKGSNTREISLGGINIPKGSVRISVGGQQLKEDKDYTVDYNLGKVTILDQGVMNSGQQIKIDFENNNQFGFQQRNLMGTRLDYRVNKKFNIGGTVMRMSERPFTQKVNLGEDPISNTIVGLDVKYETNAPWLTKALDALPVYSTKEMSTISAYGEFAHLFPGHQKAINGTDKQGQVYVDDFEGAVTGYDLKQPTTAWKLASTPRNSPGPDGKVLFPEANFVGDLRYGYNRAKLAWYRIDNSFFSQNLAPAVVWGRQDLLNDHYSRLIRQKEVFPNKPVQTLDANIYSFDLGYYPRERGPYNYESSANITPGISSGVNADGSLKDPETRWGGIMRSLDNTDLEATNVEFIEFWMMDPFLKHPTSPGGKLYINLGNVSEDILRDSRMQFENGLSKDKNTMDKTAWGQVPKLPPLVNAFDNDPNNRTTQDVGFDGLGDQEERDSLQNTFLNNITFMNSDAQLKLTDDPSSDDYHFFGKTESFFDNEPNILNRYKYYNGPDGNSPNQGNNNVSNSGTSLPDAEDLNRDNTLNENEEYFQYRIDMSPGMDVGNNKYIVSKVENAGVDGNNTPVTWYQFRVPIRNYDNKVGGIPDFKSIQFMRMFMHGWGGIDTAVILRFATLDLIRNQWRTYNLPIDPGSENTPIDNDQSTYFNVSRASIEENSSKTPVNYILPPGIERTQAIGSQTNTFVQQNEQALSAKVCGLTDGKSRAVFKNLTLDIRRYKRVKMFVHANRVEGETAVKDGEVTAFVRLGSDFKDNYYQYEIPLHMTPDRSDYKSENAADRDSVWPAANNVDISLEDLVNLKIQRNSNAGYPRNVPFTITVNNRILTIVGNPDIGSLKTVMLGIKNPLKGDVSNPRTDDDGLAKCVEVWFNELRVSEFDERGGTAAVADVAIKLADLGKLNLSGGMHTRGFGQIEQRIDQRYKDNLYQYAVSSNLELGKFFPAKWGVRLPFYGSIAQTFSAPEFDPFQLDIPTELQEKQLKGDSLKEYKKTIQTRSTRSGYNFSGVRIMPQTKATRPHIYDPGNFSFTYAYNKVLLSDPFVQKNSRETYLGQIGWNFAPQSKEFFPFKKIIKSKSKWLDLIRDFNFNLMPATMSFNTDLNRDYQIIQLRALGGSDYNIPATYNKSFRWSRVYGFKYSPFKSLSFDYGATNLSRIDEPDGAIDSKEKKNVIWNNFKQGGRNTNFSQNMSINYTLPLNKIPLFDFVTANVGYSTTYGWVASSLVRDSATGNLVANPLGNIINNSQNDRGKVDLNFKKIYDKVPFLKTYNSPNPNLGDKKENDKKRDAVKKAREKILEDIDKLKRKKEELKASIDKLKTDGSLADSVRTQRIKVIKKDIKNTRKQIRQKRKDYNQKQYPANTFISIIMRPLLSLKKVTVEYKETKSTVLPGFMPSTQLIGNDIKRAAPGYDFSFGNQPGDKLFGNFDRNARNAWLDRAAAKGWITADTLLNQKFVQTRQTRLDITASFEPFTDLKVDLNLFKDLKSVLQKN